MLALDRPPDWGSCAFWFPKNPGIENQAVVALDLGCFRICRDISISIVSPDPLGMAG